MNSNGDADNARALTVGATKEEDVGSPRDATRRLSSRVEARDGGAVKVHNVSYAVEICDVSRDGAQIRVRRGLVPFVGQAVILQFVNGTSVKSRVVWQRDTQIGLRFDEPLPDEMDAVSFEDLGSDYFRGILKMQTLRG